MFQNSVSNRGRFCHLDHQIQISRTVTRARMLMSISCQLQFHIYSVHIIIPPLFRFQSVNDLQSPLLHATRDAFTLRVRNAIAALSSRDLWISRVLNFTRGEPVLIKRAIIIVTKLITLMMNGQRCDRVSVSVSSVKRSRRYMFAQRTERIRRNVNDASKWIPNALNAPSCVWS